MNIHLSIITGLYTAFMNINQVIITGNTAFLNGAILR